MVGVPSFAIYATNRIDSQIDAQIAEKTKIPIQKANEAVNNLAVELEKITVRIDEKSKSIRDKLIELDDRRHAWIVN
jgi:hypothetical protein